MIVSELLELLGQAEPTAEIRLATQPSWPLAFNLRGMASQADIDIAAAYENLDDLGLVDEDEIAQAAAAIVWLVEGTSCEQPYAPRAAWEACER